MGQYVHSLPKTADYIDWDDPYETHSIVRRHTTNGKPLWWHIEVKQRGGSLGRAQQHFLPLLQKSIDLSVEAGVWHEKSRIFIVRTDPPFLTGSVQRFGSEEEIELEGEEWNAFLIATSNTPASHRMFRKLGIVKGVGIQNLQFDTMTDA